MGIFHSIMNPAIYHGHRKTASFFEGWYYKLISEDQTEKYAIIPGVFLGNDTYAFIQVLNGTTSEVNFIKYPLEAFVAAKDKFEIQIGNSRFQLDNIQIDIARPNLRLKGKLSFSNVIGWPITFASPGVMGWYAWVPRMECYHGVLGFDHKIKGFLQTESRKIDFTGGHGYIEKDWGTAFPKGYVWMQSNHFQQSKVSLTASIALIPWLGGAFRGFIVGLWIEGKLYRFATYTGAKTDLLEITDSEVIWKMSDRNYSLEIIAKRGKTGDLKGPTRQDMGMRVAESLTAVVYTKLTSSSGGIIFDGIGQHAGLEVTGDIERLLKTE